MDDLRALKRAAFLAIGEGVAGLTVAGTPVRLRRSVDALRVEVDLPDGSHGLVHLATIKHGLPVGAFAVDPSALVYGGRVRGVLERLPVPGRHIAGLGAILSSKGPRDAGPPRPLPVTAIDAPVIAGLVAAVRETFLPLLAAFSGEWSSALQHTLTHPHDVDRPYSAAVVLSLLAGRGALPAAVEAAVANDPAFWDRSAALAAPGWRERAAALVAAAP